MPRYYEFIKGFGTQICYIGHLQIIETRKTPSKTSPKIVKIHTITDRTLKANNSMFCEHRISATKGTFRKHIHVFELCRNPKQANSSIGGCHLTLGYFWLLEGNSWTKLSAVSCVGSKIVHWSLPNAQELAIMRFGRCRLMQ